MQRQSLGGSPSSLLLSPSLNRDVDLDDDKKSAKSPSKPRRFSIPFSSSSYSPSSPLSPPPPSSPTLPPQHKFIHAIPLLTLLCFLVLFLFSHDPSTSDLAQFKGFKRTRNDVTDPRDLIDGDGYRGGVGFGGMAVRSWRNLQQSHKSRVNRKFADF